MKIVGISGSIRNQSFNTLLLSAAAQFLPQTADFVMLAIDRLDHYNEDLDGERKPPEVSNFLRQIESASVILFASPEYNHSMPGGLKNAIDWASRPAFKSPLLNKPCGILTASMSPVGGARAQTDLKNVLLSTLSRIYPVNEYLLPNAHEKFDAEGQLIDAAALRRLKRYVEGLVAWASVNKPFLRSIAMQINVHQSESRGLADLGWLYSRHTYSFSSYHNPDRMGFGKLRVINDDIVQPSMGFGTHPHENMEIISIPLRGSLRHKDSIGNEHIIQSGEVQIMSAGTGIQHSEHNDSDADEVNFLQIWVLPKFQNIPPRYDQKIFDADGRHNQLQLVVSPTGDGGSITINQNAYFSLADVDKGHSLNYVLNDANNGIYILVISGEISIDDCILKERDGAEISDINNISVVSKSAAQLLFIEVPMS